MFPFSSDDPKMGEFQPGADAPKTSAGAPTEHPLDALTGGVFSAATSGERAQRLRTWLAANPAVDQMQAVYKELAAKDKGAARPLREKLDELRRERNQGVVTDEWSSKAEALLATTRLNIADALAWQRDAARAGAPLSREPLAGLRARLMERTNQIEDLQKRVSVQCEAAVLLAQRIELLSTKPWRDAQTAREAMVSDTEHWRNQAQAIVEDSQWPSVDLRYPPQLENAQGQLTAVWDAFESALNLAVAADQDSAAPLPPVPVWADEIARARSSAVAASDAAVAQAKPAKPKAAAPTPEQIATATQAVQTGVMLLEQAVAGGQTKNMNSAVQALRQSLKTHGRLVDDALATRVHAALVSAGELQGWQRWSADQLREQLVARAEALLVRRKAKHGQATKSSGKADKAGKGAQSAPEAAAQQPAIAETKTEVQPDTSEAATQPLAEASDSTPNVAPVPTPPEAEPMPEEASLQVSSADASESTVSTPAPTELPEAAEPVSEQTPEQTSEQGSTDEAGADPAPQTVEREQAQYDLIPAFTGRKLQDMIRKLREDWRVADQGGAPNLALWKRFDRACNAAHRFVDEWLEKSRAETAQHKAQREALINEVQTWTAAQAFSARDWKSVNRQVHQFSERWRASGHLPEAVFAPLQARWKSAINAAAAPLEAAQKDSIARRHALIAEAQQLAQAVPLRIDAVRALQQRWQADAQAVPLERKHEQKLWDAFRKPIDEAFQKKSAEREKNQAVTSAHDRAVLDAVKVLETANAGGDARQIRAAMVALEAVLRGESVKADATAAHTATSETVQTSPIVADAVTQTASDSAAVDGAAAPETGAQTVAADALDAPTEPVVDSASEEAPSADAVAAPVAAPVPSGADEPAEPPKPVKRLIAMRGDDRPGMKKTELKPEGRGKFGDRRERDDRGGRRFGERGGRFDDRGPRQGGRGEDRRDGLRPPRLGDAAFRAQREALENAQMTLRKLAAQAHGEALTGLVAAWQQRAAQALPAAPEFGRAVTPAIRNRWQQALIAAPAGDASQALLRLEMASGVPTPAEHLDARRALQLTLLTRRNDPQPVDTWVQDTAAVLTAVHDDTTARRLQAALKVLLRG